MYGAIHLQRWPSKIDNHEGHQRTRRKTVDARLAHRKCRDTGERRRVTTGRIFWQTAKFAKDSARSAKEPGREIRTHPADAALYSQIGPPSPLGLHHSGN